jgi:hypothetical protein
MIEPGRRDEGVTGIWVDGEFTDEYPEFGTDDVDLIERLHDAARGNGCPEHWEPDCPVCDEE